MYQNTIAYLIVTVQLESIQCMSYSIGVGDVVFVVVVTIVFDLVVVVVVGPLHCL